MVHIKQYEIGLDGKLQCYIVRKLYHKPYDRIKQKGMFKFELNEFEKLVQFEYNIIQYETN